MNMNVLVLDPSPSRRAFCIRRLSELIHTLALLAMLVLASSSASTAQSSVRTGATLRNLNLRTAPNLDSQVLRTLPDGATFTLVESSGEWIRVRTENDQEGWLYSPFVRLDPPRAAGAAAPATPRRLPSDAWSGVTLESLNLRTGPSTANPRIVLLPPRMRLEILEQREDWLRVRADGSEGWVSGEYVRVTDQPVQAADLSAQHTSVEPPEAPVRIGGSGPGSEQRIRELTNENSRLATELAESTARLVQSDRERASLRDERDGLRASLEALQTELIATRSALVEAAQATGDHSDAQSELSDVRERLDQSRERIMALEQEIAELQRTRSDLEARLESSTTTAQQLESAAEVERARQTQLQQELQAANVARDEANASIAVLTSRIQDLESEKETADSAGADLRTDLTRLEAERELADAEVARLESELDRARASTTQAEARVATLQDEVDDLRDAAKGREGDSDQLEQVRQDLNRLIAERAAQEESLMAASSREELLRAQLQTVGGELDAARLDVNRAVVALEELQAENEQLRRELEIQPTSTQAPPQTPQVRVADPVDAYPPADSALPFEPLVAEGSSQDQRADADSTMLEPLVADPPPERTAAAEPMPEPVPELLDPVIAASERVETWRTAWSSADVETYLDSYVDGYRPDPDTTHASWRTVRRQRLTSPSFIEVRLGTLQVVRREEDRVVLRFEQIYDSNNFSDRVMKTLTLVRTEDGDWRIETETSSPL